MSKLEDLLAFQIRQAGLPVPEREICLIPGRKFRYDFWWESVSLAIEVQGGTYMGRSGHNTGAGIERDTEKLNLAVLHNIRMMQFTGPQIRKGKAIRWLQQIFAKGL